MTRANATDDFKIEQQNRVNFNDEPESRRINKDLVEGGKANRIPVIQREGATMAEREVDLQNAIIWLRRELQEMQLQDKNLARQMIYLRAKIKNMMKVDENDVNEPDNGESST